MSTDPAFIYTDGTSQQPFNSKDIGVKADAMQHVITDFITAHYSAAQSEHVNINIRLYNTQSDIDY